MIARTLFELAELCGAAVEGDGSRKVIGPAPLGEAGREHVSFFHHPRYANELRSTRAAGVVVALSFAAEAPDHLTLLRCEDPSRAFTEIVRVFSRAPRRPAPGVHPTACAHPSAEIADTASVGPLCTVGPGSRLGEGVVLHAQVALGEGVLVGAESELFPMVVVYDGIQIGERCVIQAGCVIGSDGHGFEPSDQGWIKIPHTGTVIVEDDVEIGANTTIDRGRFGATRIGRGTKIDNLVQLGHNVIVGEGSMIVAQVGIAGSALIGAGAVLGGQAGVNGHARIGERAQVGAQSGVFGDVPAGQIVLGHPARPRTEALRSMAQAARVPGLVEKLRQLEQRVAELERERSVSGEGSA